MDDIFAECFGRTIDGYAELLKYLIALGNWEERAEGNSEGMLADFIETGPVTLGLAGWEDRDELVTAMTQGEPNKVSWVNLPFVRAEFAQWTTDAISGANPTPLSLSKMEEKYATSLLMKNHRLFYTYPERMGANLRNAIQLLANFPMTRQAFVSVWRPSDIEVAEVNRVPCTIGFHFQVRIIPGNEVGYDHVLDCNMMMRSVNALTCLPNDIWLGTKLLDWMVTRVGFAGNMNIRPGMFYMTMSNVHLRGENEDYIRGKIEELTGEGKNG